MKPAFFIVITGAETHRFASRSAARAYAALCKMAGKPAIVKPILGE